MDIHESFIFFFEAHFSVMRFLIRDIRFNLLYIGLTYRKSAIAHLPEKFDFQEIGLIDPMRGFSLDIFHNMSNVVFSGQQEQAMQMIGHAVHNPYATAEFGEFGCYVFVHGISKCRE